MIATKELVPALHPYSSEFNATSWAFYVNHYTDLNQQAQDSKMTYLKTDGTHYVGLSPPAGAKPLGINYPRASTLGGCSRHNAMISMYPKDSDWSYIANLTGDSSWAPDNMRTYFQAIENNQYLPPGVVGHGYSGWLTTSLTYLGLVLQDLKVLNLAISGTTSTTTAASTGLLGAVVSLVTTTVSSVTDLAKLLILGKDLLDLQRHFVGR
jgi:choline dehydrogenase